MGFLIFLFNLGFVEEHLPPDDGIELDEGEFFGAFTHVFSWTHECVLHYGVYRFVLECVSFRLCARTLIRVTYIVCFVLFCFVLFRFGIRFVAVVP